MVAHFFAILFFGIACQIFFLIYGLKHKAKSDKYFFSLSIISIVLLVTLGGNIFFLHFGVEGIFISKLFLSAYVSLFTVLSGTLTAINIERFSSKSKNSFLVKFIVSVIVFVICSMTFINIQTESFYSYVIRSFDPIKPIVGKYSMILIPEFGSLWELFEFFWISIIFIYLLVSVGRIIMRGPENSVKEFFILAVFFLELFFFVIYVNAPQNFIAETIIFACCVPYFYYLITYCSKPFFVKKTLRSRLFDHLTEAAVIFNADGLLTDYNKQAARLFDFNSKDIYKITLKDFVKDYVPLGTVPSDSFSIDQIYIKTKNNDKLICQLDFHKVTNFSKTTVCTYFILHNISNLFENFAEIQQASMTDHITGLFSQNVLVKKIREINIFRRFPYTAASLSVHINSSNEKINENFALIKVAECIKNKIRGSDFAAYENGNIVLLFNSDIKIAQNVIERIISAIEDDEYLKNDFTVNYGLTSKENPDEDIQQTINRAHAIMFKNKIESSIHGF